MEDLLTVVGGAVDGIIVEEGKALGDPDEGSTDIEDAVGVDEKV